METSWIDLKSSFNLLVLDTLQFYKNFSSFEILLNTKYVTHSQLSLNYKVKPKVGFKSSL